MGRLFHRDVGQVADTFGWYIWAYGRAAVLLDPAEFWTLAVSTMPPARRADFERSPELCQSALRIGPSAPIHGVYSSVAKLLHKTARRNPDWIAERQRRTISADTDGWMASLDYFSVLRPDFHFCQAVYPRHGLVMGCGLNPFDAWSKTTYDGSAGAFLPGGKVLRAHVDARGVVLDLVDGEHVYLDPVRGILATDPRAQ